MKILLIEDNQNDADLVIRFLKKSLGYNTTKIVDSEDDFLDEMKNHYDIILADYNLPGFTAVTILHLMKERNIKIPLIVVSGTIGEEKAVECIRLGAVDYLLKDRLEKLGVSIERAVKEKELSEEKEKALIKSERQYRNLFESANDSIIIFEPDTEVILEVNNKACVTYGFTREEFIGTSLKDLTYDIPKGKKQINELLQKKSYKNFETRQFTKDKKKLLDFLVNASVIEYNDKTAILSINRDITDLKAADDKIKILSKAVEQSPVSIIITDPDGNIEYVNPKFTELSGYAYDDVINRNPRLLSSGELPKEEYEELWAKILSGKEHKLILHNKKANGELYWVDAVIFPLLSNNGKILHFIGLEEDITEKKKMIEDLISAKEKAEELNRLKTNFLSNMSHELRTPLIGILGYTEMMLSEFESETHREMASTVHNSGKRLLETLNLILNLSRIETDKTELVIREIEVNELINRTYVLFKKVTDSAKVRFYLENNTPGLIIRSDERILEGILNNLLNNAVKFTHEGTIILKTEKKVYNNNDFIEFSIEDTGIGISKANLEIIFDEFRQASEGYTRKFEGTGLGLTISKRFAEILGGDISVVSELGKGSTFSFFIPYYHEIKTLKKSVKKPVITKEEIPVVENKAKVRLLVVDDDDVTRALVPLMLKGKYEVDSAEDGLTALKLMESSNYNIVLLDIALQGKLDGIGVLKELRKLPGYDKVKVVAFTAYAMNHERKKFLSEGFDGYLSKPFSKDSLNQVLEVSK